ncbi:MAG: hypothetical protein Q4C95_10120 [Planctomycetia bacterium]|nr:hypothetical protein [Planctomycetia bacterium]
MPFKSLKPKRFYQQLAVSAFLVGCFLIVFCFIYGNSVRYFAVINQRIQETVQLKREPAKSELLRQAKSFLTQRSSISFSDREKMVIAGLNHSRFHFNGQEIAFLSSQSTNSDLWLNLIEDADFLTQETATNQSDQTFNLVYDSIDVLELFENQEHSAEMNAAVHFLNQFQNDSQSNPAPNSTSKSNSTSELSSTTFRDRLDLTDSPEQADLFLVFNDQPQQFDFEKNPLNRLHFFSKNDLLIQKTTKLQLIKITAPLAFLGAFFSLFFSFGIHFCYLPLFDSFTDSLRLWLLFLEQMTQSLLRFCRVKKRSFCFYFVEGIAFRLLPLTLKQINSTHLLF